MQSSKFPGSFSRSADKLRTVLKLHQKKGSQCLNVPVSPQVDKIPAKIWLRNEGSKSYSIDISTNRTWLDILWRLMVNASTPVQWWPSKTKCSGICIFIFILNYLFLILENQTCKVAVISSIWTTENLKILLASTPKCDCRSSMVLILFVPL